MPHTIVYLLAKEFSVSRDVIINICKEVDPNVTTETFSISEDLANYVRNKKIGRAHV